MAVIREYTCGELVALAEGYQHDGAVHLPGFVGGDALSRLQALVDAAAAATEQAPKPDQVSSFLRSDGRLTIRYLWRENAALRQLLLRPEIAATLARIIGSRTLRFWFDLSFIHHGGASGAVGIGTPWHHDVPTYSFKGELMPSLWLALTPTNADLSRLMFIAGSHRSHQGLYRSPEMKKPAAGESDGFVDLPDFDALIASGEVQMLTWDCQPGDAILLHPATVHGARGHDGQGAQPRRVSLATRWLGDDARFLPHCYATARKQRAIAETNLMFGQRPHGDWFPLVYDRDQARDVEVR